MNTYQLIHGVQSLDESISYLGKELYKLKNTIKSLESEIEELKASLPKNRTSEGRRYFED